MTSLAVAASEAGRLQMVEAAAVPFVLARLAVWIGYRADPLCLAFGMVVTAYFSVMPAFYMPLLNLR